MLDAGSGHTNYLWNTGKLPKPYLPILLERIVLQVGNGTPITNNNSLSFDGVDDYIDFGNTSDFDFSNSALTVMCWVNLSSVNSIDGIISKNETFNHGWWLSTISGSPSWSNPNTFSFGGSPSNSNYFGTIHH